MRREHLDGFFAEAGEHEGRLDRLEVVGEALNRGIRRQARAGSLRRGIAVGGGGRRWARCKALVERVDLQHVGDRRDAGDRFLRELADAERQGTRKLSVEVDRAAAHSRDNPRVLSLLAVQANQDDVTLWPVHILQNAENFDVHGFRLGALKHGQSISAHARMNLAHRDRFGFSGRSGG